MDMRKWMSGLVAVAAMVSFSGLARAEDKKPAAGADKKQEGKPDAKADKPEAKSDKPAAKVNPPAAGGEGKGAPAMDPKKLAEMEAMMKAGTPGEFHNHLKPLAGKWSYTIKMWMDPASAPSESKGASNWEWIHGGRFLVQKVKGEPDEMSPTGFEGLEILGYNNVTKKYTSAWCDSMGTGLMTSEGTYDPATKTFSFTGEYDCCITNKVKTVRTTVKLIGDKEYAMEMFGTGTDGGKEFKHLEIHAKKQ